MAVSRFQIPDCTNGIVMGEREGVKHQQFILIEKHDDSFFGRLIFSVPSGLGLEQFPEPGA